MQSKITLCGVGSWLQNKIELLYRILKILTVKNTGVREFRFAATQYCLSEQLVAYPFCNGNWHTFCYDVTEDALLEIKCLWF